MVQTSNGLPRAALVTGGGRRLGEAIVDHLATQGFAVAIHCDKSSNDAHRVAARIRQNGGAAVAIEGNLAQSDDLGDLMTRATSAVGPIGLLVNNAAMFEDDSIETLSPEGLMAHLRVNLAAPCLLASAFARNLPPDANGLVVNIVDQRVLKPTPQFFSYSLSKSGLWWATRTMAQALAPRVRVVGLAPGPTLKSAQQEEADFRRQSEAVLLGRGPDLAEFGTTIRWLIETPSVTGQLIALDGGQHLAWQTPDVIGVGE